MTGTCIFLRLIKEENKGDGIFKAINKMRSGIQESNVFFVDTNEFKKVPGSPFSYWVDAQIRNLFVNLPPFENDQRVARAGLSTTNDFRFLRAWWETKSSHIVTGNNETDVENYTGQTFHGKCWIPFAKGGEYSPFYSDIHLLVNWGRNGELIKKWVLNNPNDPSTTSWSRYVRSPDFYFHPGLTWSARTNGLSFRILPSGCIFGHKGPACFIQNDNFSDLLVLCSIMNSSIFNALINITLARVDLAQSYEVGLIQSMPIPTIDEEQSLKIIHLITKALEIKISLAKIDELNHLFITLPQLSSSKRGINNSIQTIVIDYDSGRREFEILEKEIDSISYDLYGIDKNIRKNLDDSLDIPSSSLGGYIIDSSTFTPSLFSYLLGSLFGRWDIRYATGEKQPPDFPDPFAPLPACSPGMLQGDDGLPLLTAPKGYPLAIDDDGILVDDEYHPEDIITRLREVLTLIWGERADAIENEACEILGVKSLRDYFRKPSAGGFWDSHMKRYSKSRRKAPIYWLLQSSKRNYALWIYYHRLTPDTLFRALERYVKPKIQMEETRLAEMQADLKNAGTGGAAVKKLEKAIEKQELFVGELSDFKEKLERAASLFLEPVLDDGVVLTIAPLHELVPWKEAGAYWDELLEGKYEWSSIGKQMREKGMVKE